MDKKIFSKRGIIRAVFQIISFIIMPGLFINIFSAIGAVYKAIIGGSFVFGEQIGNLILLAAVLLTTLIWGRYFCGYVCSFGAMQDLLWWGGKRFSKIHIPEKVDRVLKYFKYAVLLFVAAGVWTCGITGEAVWSPWTVFGALASAWKGFPDSAVIFSIGGLLLLLSMLGSLFVERFFCKYICPLGAVFSLLSRFRIFKVKRNDEKCSGNCRLCTKTCSMSIPLYRYGAVTSGECINCMKCVSACPAENMKTNTAQAVSGTMAAVALMGMSYIGTLPSVQSVAQKDNTSVVSETGAYADGTYTGSAKGYRGTTAVEVVVENGNISEITVTSSKDDSDFLSKAKSGVIPAILASQNPDVAVVSGATFSSEGIIQAVKNALKADDAGTRESDTHAADAQQGETTTREENTQTDTQNGTFADGVYTGSGSGFRGTTSVEVTVENGQIALIRVTSYQDDDQFFEKAKSGVIEAIIRDQSIRVSTVSGATFSSNSIIEAVANALGEEFDNPNSAASGGRGHKH